MQRSAHAPEAYRLRVAELPAEFVCLEHDQQLLINGQTWQVLTARGHSPEQVCLFCSELGLLIGGDHVLAQITSNVSVWPDDLEANQLAHYLESLVKLSLLPQETLVLPSHGHPFYGLHQRLKELEEHHEARLALLCDACSDPRSVTELLPVLFQRPLDDQQLRFAVGETFAHLNYLMSQGELTRELNRNQVWLFKRGREFNSLVQPVD